MTLRTPPALRGLPLLGNILDLRRGLVPLLLQGYEAHGSIFSIRLGRQNVAVLLGPDGHRFFFDETDRRLSVPEVYRFLIPMFGEKFVIVADRAEYKEQRAIIMPCFQGHKNDSHLQAMVHETGAWLDSLGHAGAFPLLEALDRLTMFISARAFLGADFRQHMGEEFRQLYRDLADGMELVLPTNLPLPRFRRRDRARLRLHSLIRPLIEERRTRPQGHDDFLQTLAEATYSTGEPVPAPVIVNLILGMVFAAHESTAGQASWGLLHLIQHPHYLARVLEEQEEVLGDADATITAPGLRALKRLECALKESERLQPVPRVLMRYTTADYELGGYRVPKGWLTAISPATSHRLPDVFPRPISYVIDRFSTGRAEERQTPFSLVGFGGGARKCLGIHFAHMEMKVILSMLLQRYSLELVGPPPQPDSGLTGHRPKGRCLVRYRRRQGTLSRASA